jgi:hypothetical protein
MLHYVRHRQWTLELPELGHLLKLASDIPNPAIATDSLSLTVANPLMIDGVAVEDGDRIEIRKIQAQALNISPGIWTAVSDREIELTEPPVYTLRSAWDIGSPWAYQSLAGGILQGLGELTRSNVAATQKNAGAPTSNPTRFGGGLWSNVGMTSSTWQGFKVTFDELDVSKMAMRVTSQKQSYDTRFPVAEYSIALSGWGDASQFYNYETGVRQASGMATWSSGQEQFWITNAYSPAKKISWIGTNDEGMSRAICAAALYGAVPCQIKIGNEIPTNGSTLVISEAVADQFFPAIAPGNYTVLENGGVEQWQIQLQQ